MTTLQWFVLLGGTWLALAVVICLWWLAREIPAGDWDRQ